MARTVSSLAGQGKKKADLRRRLTAALRFGYSLGAGRSAA